MHPIAYCDLFDQPNTKCCSNTQRPKRVVDYKLFRIEYPCFTQMLDEDVDMWSLVLYILGVVVGLVLIYTYNPEKPDAYGETEHQPNPWQLKKKSHEFRFSSIFASLGLNWESIQHFHAFTDHFHSFEEVSSACRRAGLESCNVIIAVDFTASNEWQGRKSFNQNCLHKVYGQKLHNPYQKVIWILGQVLTPFSEENLIPTFGFGDSQTTDEDVFPFKYDGSPCHGFQDVLDKYNEVVRRVSLAGPTSFAPVIRKAIEIVKETKSYQILVIIADGQVTEEKPTIDAIVEASEYPISIIVVGVGDGPWAIMEEFDHRLPKRKFDNFRFVDYHKATFKSKNPDTAFALQALMEIPDQYKTSFALGYILETDQKSESQSDSVSARSNSRIENPSRKTPESLPCQQRSRRRTVLPPQGGGGTPV